MLYCPKCESMVGRDQASTLATRGKCTQCVIAAIPPIPQQRQVVKVVEARRVPVSRSA